MTSASLAHAEITLEVQTNKLWSKTSLVLLTSYIYIKSTSNIDNTTFGISGYLYYSSSFKVTQDCGLLCILVMCLYSPCKMATSSKGMEQTPRAPKEMD